MSGHADDPTHEDGPARASGVRPAEDGPGHRPPVRVTVLAEGPILVEGPVEVIGPDGTVRVSERPVVALCACRRSRRSPFCDTSHRRRGGRRSDRRADPGASGPGGSDPRGSDPRGSDSGGSAGPPGTVGQG